MLSPSTIPWLGVGLGYRPELRRVYQQYRDRIDFLELIADWHVRSVPNGQRRAIEIAGEIPVVVHGLDLSLGTAGEVDVQYCDMIGELVRLVGAPYFTDHICFTQAGGLELGHLLPLPYTEAMARRCARKARQVQQILGVPLLLENITYPFRVPGSMSEAQFIRHIVEEADCNLLLDVTNIYINSHNHGYDPHAFLDELPLERVVQVHLAGGEKHGGRWFDSHSQPIGVHPEVWRLLEHVAGVAPLRGAVIERDENYPSDPAEILDDLARAREIIERAGARARSAEPLPVARPVPIVSPYASPPQELPVETAAFQVALARLLAEPALYRQAPLDLPSVGRVLDLDEASLGALREIGPEHIADFAESLRRKRVAQFATRCPASFRLLRRHGHLDAALDRFIEEHPPRLTAEYPTRTLRDAFRWLEFLEGLSARGALQMPHLDDVVQFERTQLSLSALPDEEGEMTSPLVPPAGAARALTHEQILAARPRLRSAARIARFSCDIALLIRALQDDADLPGAAPKPTLVLFVRAPGQRNVTHVRLDSMSAGLLERCDDKRTASAIIEELSAGDTAGLRDAAVKRLRELHRLGAVRLGATLH